MQDDFDRLTELLKERFDTRFLVGTPRSIEEVRHFVEEHRLGLTRSREGFLANCDGIRFGHDILFGIQDLLIDPPGERLFAIYPQWMGYSWWPISTDGCGNYWVESTAHGGVVLFVDCGVDPNEPSYVAASNLWIFARGLVRRASAQNYAEEIWPFDADSVLAFDPNLVRVHESIPLPWEA